MDMRTYMRPTYVTSFANHFEHAHLTGFEPGEVPDDLLSLDALRALPREAPPLGGVYFMWRGPQLLYIGSSMEDLAYRVFGHRRAQIGIRSGHIRYRFTHFTIMVLPLTKVQEMEYRYIQAYLPPHNRRERNTGFDTRVPLTRGAPTASGTTSEKS